MPETKLTLWHSGKLPDRRRARNRIAFLHRVVHEMENQDRKWGADRDLPPGTWLRVLVEEVGECAKEINDGTSGVGLHNLYLEVIQVAAVACQWGVELKRELSGVTYPPQPEEDR